MNELTKAEEPIMQVLWQMGKGYLKDIVDALPEPKPAYPTVSTVLRVMVKKKFIAYNTYGKVHEYYPLIRKEDYFKTKLKGMLTRFFGNSWQGFATFFSNTDMTVEELEAIKAEIDKEIKKQNS
ncbi:BlaI/MecI/CopY family transcriptional regulator [Fulvivirga sp. 29W222]|uniref:BlaI/MecI/CopY family transcriptional regulator n=1 Tax=Fulvivirga marina TaxID=2494733 RepID=A0A937KC94_9BACT|nr:BlaI/MecI/CopY family transcriptional regulator [Fulvivirga marina]MBL6444725.1 BlaI/MecI/CopY family transcriptional regulator [Fulvivirga marina]